MEYLVETIAVTYLDQHKTIFEASITSIFGIRILPR